MAYSEDWDVARPGEFGWPGEKPLRIGMGVAAVLYGIGWLVEDSQYWLAMEAVVMWGGVLPAWLCAVALAWRPQVSGWFVGVLAAVPIFIVHVVVMWFTRGRLNDDYLGIGAIFAGVALGGWVLGRILHVLVRRVRAQAGL